MVLLLFLQIQVPVSKRFHKQDTSYWKINTLHWVLLGFSGFGLLLRMKQKSRETCRAEGLLLSRRVSKVRSETELEGKL